MMTPESLDYRPDYAVPPGETLLEALADRDMTQVELARRMSRPKTTINEIVKGKAAITPETALQLEAVLGVPAGFWLNREARYREVLARHARLDELVAETKRVSDFPYASLVKLGFVSASRRPEEKVESLRSFFGVDSLAKLDGRYAAVLRVARTKQPSPGALMAWLRIGELRAQELQVADFDQTLLIDRIPALRALTLLAPPQAGQRLRAIMAECGMHLVYVPHLPQTYAHGATRWYAGRPLIQLSVRGKWEDIFWFSLFHEIGHILRGHSRKETLIAWDGKDRKDAQELEADQFAADTLIRPDDYESIKQLPCYSGTAVREFAAEIGVCPGVVVGRLQNDNLLPHAHLNNLRRKLQIVPTAE